MSCTAASNQGAIMRLMLMSAYCDPHVHISKLIWTLLKDSVHMDL